MGSIHNTKLLIPKKHSNIKNLNSSSNLKNKEEKIER